MTGTLVNVAAVLAGSLLGLLIKNRMPKRLTEIVFQVLGLFTLFLGVSMALKTNHLIYLIFSLLLGGISGELLRLEERMDRFGAFLKRKLPGNNERFQEGLITAFLLFCMGSMTILGAIEEGINNNPDLLLTKSLMDGFSSIALAAALGVGVLLSAIPLLIFQGGLTLLASSVQDFLLPEMIAEITAVGGVMLIGLGINILGIKKLRIMNMLPALLFVVLMVMVFGGS